MKKIVFYRTSSYGGMEGRDLEKRDFETKELAMENALYDDWNDHFLLFEVTMTFDEFVTTSEKFLGEIPCVRSLNREKEKELRKEKGANN